MKFLLSILFLFLSCFTKNNLPTSNTDYSNLQTSAFTPNNNWYRTFEWTDCWNRINPANPNDPNNVSTDACVWTPFEKRFSNVTVLDNGKIKVDFAYHSGEEAIGNPEDTNFTPIKTHTESYQPYDLIVFVNKSGIESINEATTGGVVIVPALFLKYAYDKAFNQQLYDAASTTMTIAGIFGIDEVMLASKALSRVPKIKSMIKWIWRDKIASYTTNLDELVAWVGNNGLTNLSRTEIEGTFN